MVTIEVRVGDNLEVKREIPGEEPRRFSGRVSDIYRDRLRHQGVVVVELKGLEEEKETIIWFPVGLAGFIENTMAQLDRSWPFDPKNDDCIVLEKSKL